MCGAERRDISHAALKYIVHDCDYDLRRCILEIQMQSFAAKMVFITLVDSRYLMPCSTLLSLSLLCNKMLVALPS